MHRLSIRLAAPLLLVACSSEPVQTPGDSSESGGEETSSSGDTSSTGDSPTTTEPEPVSTGETVETTVPGDTTSDTTGPAAPPVCGNGIVEGDEPCDDANDDPDDGCNKLCGRTGVPIWTRSWDSGAKQDDYGASVRSDGDGHIYVGGTVEKGDNYSDAVVRKLDSSGEELAQFVYAGQLGLDDGGTALGLGGDGSVYLGGYEQIVADGPNQSFVRKFAADGAPVWTFTQPSVYVEGISQVSGLAVAGDAIYVAGSEEIDDKVYQTYIHRLDPDDGTPVWTAHIDVVGFHRHGLDIAPNGDLLVATASLGPNNTAVATVVRYTEDGDELWFETFGGVGNARAIAVHPDGDLAVTGWLIGDFNDTNFWTARLTSEGETIWSVKYDHDDRDDMGSGIVWSPDGDIYVAGFVIKVGEQQNAYVRRLTGDGADYWSSFYNGAIDLNDTVNGVALTDEHLIVVGTEVVSGSGPNQWIRAYQH